MKIFVVILLCSKIHEKSYENKILEQQTLRPVKQEFYFKQKFKQKTIIFHDMRIFRRHPSVVGKLYCYHGNPYKNKFTN